MTKHPVILRGYQAAINDRAAEPVIVKRLDQEFIPAVLDGFRRKLSSAELGRLGGADTKGGHFRLFQPVHRTFNLLLLEAVCDRPGSSRLNPRDIASAGFVLRRVNSNGDQGWLLRDERVIGWGRIADPKLDPDPTHRKPRLDAGNLHINGKLARLNGALEPAAERVSRLFVAPPDVCAAAGRTLLYGLIPVTSSERSEKAEPVEIDPEIVAKVMPSFLLGPNNESWPDIGAASISPAQVNELIATEPNHPLSRLMQHLRLIHFGWRAFDPVDGALILPLLNEVTLRFPDQHTETLGVFLHTLTRRFVSREDGSSGSITPPNQWPQPSAELAARIRSAVAKSLEARLNEGVPNEQRFEDSEALYRIHSFIRVRCDAGCPPVLHWAAPTAPFSIVPWWESGGSPLHTISLPDFDRESIKKVKPNIAFKVPPRLAAMLNQKPDDFLKGKATLPGGGLTLGWICSFSIPIITLCAFIVLNLFLVLLHLAFQWLFYIKICLPFPKPQPSNS
jgi:hypothetical protein